MYPKSTLHADHVSFTKINKTIKRMDANFDTKNFVSLSDHEFEINDEDEA